MVMKYTSEFKILKMIVVLFLMFIVVTSSYHIKTFDNVHATRFIIKNDDGKNIVILSNDGSGDANNLLTCGEVICLYVVNNSLKPFHNYSVKVWNGTQWVSCYAIKNTTFSDKYGDLSIQFHVPGFKELGKHPVKDNGIGTDENKGKWNISLWSNESDSNQIWTGLNITLTIGNLYDVFYTRNVDDSYGNRLKYLLYNNQESFYINVRNWTGNSGWQHIYDGENGIGAWNLSIIPPLGEDPIEFISNVQANKQFVTINVNDSDLPSSPNQYEYMYWINVTKYNSEPILFSNVTLPIKLNVTADLPSNAEWGDTVEISGYVLDGNGTGMSGYTVRLYAPTDTGLNGAYTSAYSTETYSTGRYSISVETGPDTGYGCGTWYLGTYDTGENPPRIDESDQIPYQADFIPYYSFDVGTKDDAKVTVRNTEDIISDFEQTINVSVYNHSWMWSGSSDGVLEYQNMYFQVTGLDGWDGTYEYGGNDIVPVTATMTKVDSNEKYAYYEFNWMFNETGTATIWASWPGNLTDYEGNDSYESNTYNANVSILNNITGKTTFNVVSPSEMNLVISGTMVDSVQVTESGDNWKNTSQSFTLNVYGDSSSERMNATIKITGCGLDITIEEDDTVAGNEYLTAKSNGQYTIKIQPKTAGTLTITADNDTEGTSVTQDYTITGLTGSVTTSDGDDIAITVGSTETITATITNGNFAEVHLTYYDSNWANPNSLNITIGDGTAGEGEGGVFTFVPDEDDLESVGFIVVAAKAGSSSYMYDVIEIEPIYDLTIDLISPISTNESFTVGMEVDITLQLLDDEGNQVTEDMPFVIGKFIDNNHNEYLPLQTIEFTKIGSYWEAIDVFLWKSGTFLISGYNASTGMRHEGNIAINVKQATISYQPYSATAGIGMKNLTIKVEGLDANENPLPEGTHLFFWCEDSEDPAVGGSSTNIDAVNFKTGYEQISLDENGTGIFILEEIGDNKTVINATLQDNNPLKGNDTAGYFTIDHPSFTIEPEIIYIGQSNVVKITAKDANNDPIQGINLTLYSSIPGVISVQPDPVETNKNGEVEFTLIPIATGILNITIARNITYIDGKVNWTNAIITDSYLTVAILKQMKISLSQAKIYESDTLLVQITSEENPLSDVSISFAGTTEITNAQGLASFIAPKPISNSEVYTVSAEKSGYASAEKSVTVLKDIYEPFIEFIKPTKGLYFFNSKIIPFVFINPVIIGDIDIIVNGYDKGTGIEKVEFSIDGVLKQTLYDPPYIFTWSNDRLVQIDFRYQITATCYDHADNENEINLIIWRFL